MCANSVTSARYGFDRARLLAIHTRLTNHIPRGSRCKESAAFEDAALQVLSQPVSVPQSELKSPRSTAASLLAQDPNAPGALQLEKAEQNKSSPSSFPEQCDCESSCTLGFFGRTAGQTAFPKLTPSFVKPMCLEPRLRSLQTEVNPPLSLVLRRLLLRVINLIRSAQSRTVDTTRKEIDDFQRQ